MSKKWLVDSYLRLADVMNTQELIQMIINHAETKTDRWIKNIYIKELLTRPEVEHITIGEQ